MQHIPQVFPGWQADELIGRGAYGKVYKASHAEGGHASYAAIKVVEIPPSDEDVKSLHAMGMDAASIRSYYEGTAHAIMDEVSVMSSLKDSPHVVHIDDFKLLERGDGVGWAIYIRMELLESLDVYQQSHGLPDVHEVARIGMDVCDALASCHNAGVIHRDVKPANLFVSRFGSYKLGDFGVARRLDEASGSTKSRAGTDAFMAPEVASGHYDFRADVYSLGVVLYRWLNGGRPPFVSSTGSISQEDVRRAQLRRSSGERPPAPMGPGVDPELAAIVCKAVEPDPSNRWQSANEFGSALESWLGDGAERASVPMRGADACASIVVPAALAESGCVATVAYAIGSEPRSLKMKVPAGTRDGAAFKLAGYGGPGTCGGPAGDLLVSVSVQASPTPVPVPASDPAPVQAPSGKPSLLTRRAVIAGGAAMAVLVAYAALTSGSCGKDSPVDLGQDASVDTNEEVGEPEVVESGTIEEATPEPEPAPTLSLTIEQAARYSRLIDAGQGLTVALHSDGTVVAAGDNSYGQCDVSSWSDIIAVFVGDDRIVGLRSNGTLIATAGSSVDISAWEDIVSFSESDSLMATVGLHADGTVEAWGIQVFDAYEELSAWDDIVAIAAGSFVVAALRSDGTLATVCFEDEYGLTDASGWSDIVAVSVGNYHIVGLRSDGTVVAAGGNEYGQCDVSDWSDIVAISAGDEYTVGLRSNGTVVAVGWENSGRCDVSEWTGIVAIAAAGHTVGLRADGTVVAAGSDGNGQCDVSSWTGITLG